MRVDQGWCPYIHIRIYIFIYILILYISNQLLIPRDLRKFQGSPSSLEFFKLINTITIMKNTESNRSTGWAITHTINTNIPLMQLVSPSRPFIRCDQVKGLDVRLDCGVLACKKQFYRHNCE